MSDDLIRLAARLRAGGRLTEALRLCSEALLSQPDDPSWICEQARCYLTGQQTRLAIEGFSRARDLVPESAECRFGLGLAQQISGSWLEATQSFREAGERDPDFVEAHLRLGQLLLNLGSREEAIGCFKRVLELSPGLLEAEALCAESLLELGRDDEARQYLSRVESDDPADAVNLGFRLQVLGRFEESDRAFRRALELAPTSGPAFYGLVRGRKITESDSPLIAQMEATAGDRRLPAVEKLFVHYALAKSFEDVADYRKAMQQYDEANGLAATSRNVSLNLEKLVQYNDWRIRAYQAEPLMAARRFGSDSEKPIFVIGMIRSGTTLVEQMLSGHPSISGAGELQFWSVKQEIFNQRFGGGSLNAEFIKETASEYLGTLDQLGPEASRVIDKMPSNFLSVGAIHMVLPRARFIHVRRRPIDNCLSIYTTYFESSPAYAHRREAIVAYYREYERLMNHWRSVMPPKRFIEVEYERLTENPEREMRRLLAFCGLEWDEACFHPEQNHRAVRTPSVWQVRQPVYTSSTHRWRNFAPWLEEFSEVLTEEDTQGF